MWLPYNKHDILRNGEKSSTLGKGTSLYSLQNNVNKSTEQSRKYFSRLGIIGVITTMFVAAGVSQLFNIGI